MQPYEANEIGYSFDQGNESFMDFKLSEMLSFSTNGFPIDNAVYYNPFESDTKKKRDPDAYRFTRPLFFPRFDQARFYFAVNERAGMYFTRHSAPVVEKRFNALFAFRWWLVDPAHHNDYVSEAPKDYGASRSDYLEITYAHESNGQYIDSKQGLIDQYKTYLDDGNPPTIAYHSARDNISRGWDYFGLQLSQSGLLGGNSPWAVLSVKSKLSYYLSWSPPQGYLEQYDSRVDITEASLEALAQNVPGAQPIPLPEGKPRRKVDGVSVRVDLLPAPWEHRKLLYSFTLIGTTGYADFLRYDTLQGEVGLVRLWRLPLVFWMRYGYNQDLTDYFRKSQSVGLKLTWGRF
jgi:hypothetical protein